MLFEGNPTKVPKLLAASRIGQVGGVKEKHHDALEAG
jgi:hypothetical protein